MHRWQIGDVSIVRVEDLDFSVPSDRPVPEWCVPDLATSVDEVGVAFSALAIQADGTTIVVDPWLANDGPREQDDASDHAEALLDQLAGSAFPADEVDIVVNSHLDGVGWKHPTEQPGLDPLVPEGPLPLPGGRTGRRGRRRADQRS